LTTWIVSCGTSSKHMTRSHIRSIRRLVRARARARARVRVRVRAWAWARG
jgi:hypothetical protein